MAQGPHCSLPSGTSPAPLQALAICSLAALGLVGGWGREGQQGNEDVAVRLGWDLALQGMPWGSAETRGLFFGKEKRRQTSAS